MHSGVALAMPGRPFTIPLTASMATRLRATGIPYVDDDDESESRESSEQSYEELLDQLPALDADIVRMTLLGIGQQHIADLFGTSQANISHHLKAAARRMRFLISRPQYSREEVASRVAMIRVSEKPLAARIQTVLVDYWFTGNLSASAATVGMSQGSYVPWLRRVCSITDPAVQDIIETFRGLKSLHGWAFRSENLHTRKAAYDARHLRALTGEG